MTPPKTKLSGASPGKGLTPLGAFACGFLMGTADAVPGVSGGTMALILGIYDRFIRALGVLVALPRELSSRAGRHRLARALALLAPLGAGLLLALFLGTRLLVGGEQDWGLLKDPATAPYCYAFFFGLVMPSALIPWRHAGEHTRRTVGMLLLGASLAWLFAGLQQVRGRPETWMLSYGGALAISVMLLPGISGSLLLVMLNQYQTVVSALHSRHLLPLLVFGGGLLAGAALFVPLLRLLLKRVHGPTMALLTGLMLGSLRALWPWKSNYDLTQGPLANISVSKIGEGSGSLLVVLFFALLGAAVVALLNRVERALAAPAEAP